MKVELIGAGPRAATYRFSVDGQAVAMVGRCADATVRIEDLEVSRCHCDISQVGDILMVRDMDSTNGTFINGLKISEAHLMPGDELKIGKTAVLVHYEGGPVRSRGISAIETGASTCRIGEGTDV
jgi:adenylate cyclase